MAATIKSRVQRGAKLLDERSPGWVYKVKIKELDIGSECHCVLGQVYGGYLVGLEAVGVAGAFGPDATHGFDVDMETNQPYEVQYVKLTKHWKNEIRKRRGKSGTRGKKKVKA